MSKQMWIPCEHGSVGDCKEGGVIWSCPGGRLATTADKVAALREEGGEVLTLELDEFDGGYGFADENGITIMPDDGTYLVARIEGTPQ